MRCKTCHYSLSGLPEPRCPECGNAFDPNDPSTFLTVRQIAVDRLQRYSGSAGLILALLTIFILATLTHRPLLLILMLPPIVTVAFLTWKHRRA